MNGNISTVSTGANRHPFPVRIPQNGQHDRWLFIAASSYVCHDGQGTTNGIQRLLIFSVLERSNWRCLQFLDGDNHHVMVASPRWSISWLLTLMVSDGCSPDGCIHQRRDQSLPSMCLHGGGFPSDGESQGGMRRTIEHGARRRDSAWHCLGQMASWIITCHTLR